MSRRRGKRHRPADEGVVHPQAGDEFEQVQDTSERTATENLLVVMDLGAGPSLEVFSSQASALTELYLQCQAITSVYGRMSDNPNWKRTDVFVKRMSLASPWQVVLTEAIRGGSPYAMIPAAGYTTLQAMKFILDLKMKWDNHQTQRKRDALQLDKDKWAFATEVSDKLRETVQLASRFPSMEVESQERTIASVHALFPVKEVESITDDDPRG